MNILVSEYQKELITMFTKITNDKGEYYFIPYWFKRLEPGDCFELISFDKLPLDLKETINKQKRDEKFFNK